MEDLTKKYYELFSSSWIQTFDDAKLGRKELVTTSLLKNTSYKNLSILNENGAGIYIQPNEGKSRKEDDLNAIEWLYVDMDEGTKAEMMAIIALSPIKPDIIVESKRSYHLYWKTSCTKEQFKIIIDGLITFYNGDIAISSPNEVLRAPAFFHCKDPQNKFKIVVQHLDIQKHTPQDFMRLYPTISHKMLKRYSNENPDDVLRVIKNIDITEILKYCGVDVRRGVIFEGGVATSASVWKEGNIVKRFSGKEGGGSTIDIVMHHLGKNVAEAIAFLKDYAGIIDETIFEKITKTSKNKEQDNLFEKRVPFTFGTKKLDENMTPIEKWHCNIFAGESGSGKTAFCFYMAKKNADLGHRVLFLSLEMSTDEIIERHAREKFGITKSQWRERWNLSSTIQSGITEEKEKLYKYANLTLAGFPETIMPTPENIASVITEGKFDLVFIDNFDLVASDIRDHIQKTESVSKFFMNFTKDKKVPLMILHHFNKGGGMNKTRSNDSFRGSAKVVHNASNTFVGARSEGDIGTPNEKAEFTIAQKKDRGFGIGGLCTVYYSLGNFQDLPPNPGF